LSGKPRIYRYIEWTPGKWSLWLDACFYPLRKGNCKGDLQ
jgi:hypothetical protein